MATAVDLERVVRKVLNEGTGFGQKSWAGTSKATLRGIQHVSNLVTQQVIPRLAAPGLSPNLGVAESIADDPQAGDLGEGTDGEVPPDGEESSELVIPAPALMALEELYFTLTAEQAGTLATFFAALSGQEQPSEQL